MGGFAGKLGTSLLTVGALVGAVACGAGGPGMASKSAPAAEAISQDAPSAGASPQSAPPAPADEGASSDAAPSVGGKFREEVARPEQPRPGLGTEWGESRSSRITTSPFVRGDSVPFAVASMFYNDDSGARAMANAAGGNGRSSDGRVDIGNGVATLLLKDGNGRFLTGFEAGEKEFIAGQVGTSYTIVVQSHVPARLEVVVSVDGLDVLDGKAAATGKRGYLVDPQGTLEIEGFRQSTESVAAFRFGAVSQSYASKKHGETRNVGVIGVALFNEQGSNPRSWSRGDVNRRLDANPFPGGFATPPSN